MKQHGYTLIELLIVITIVGILFSTGLSAYSTSRDKQEIRSMGESLETVLREAQKKASVGDADCIGALKYIQIWISLTNNNLSTKAYCENNEGAAVITNIDNLDFIGDLPDPYIRFKPLNQGLDLRSGDSLNIVFSSLNSGLTHTIIVSKPGSITYHGTALIVY